MRRCSLWVLVCLVAAGWADVSLVQDRLSADVLAWANVRWLRWQHQGLTTTTADFYRRAMFVGLTGRVSPVVSTRAYLDVGNFQGQPAYDLYVDCRWPVGIGLRVGQFKPALGFEAMTRPDRLKLIEYSMVSRYWKPGDPRDIGMMGSYEHRLFNLSAAIINGNGRNQGGDDNNYKDICGRVLLKPLKDAGIEFAVRGYSGRTGSDRVKYENVAFELKYERSGYQVLVEAGRAWLGTLIRDVAYVQGSVQVLDFLEPVVRVHIEDQADDEYELGATAGLNFLVLGDQLKVMVNYDYWKKWTVYPVFEGSSNKVLVQVQASL